MIRKVFIALFVAMAAGQLLSLGGFIDAVETYGVGGRIGAWLFAVSIVALEVGAVALLVGASRRRLGATATIATMTAWTALAAQAFARGLVVPNCGCFGTFLSQELRWWVLVEDAYLLVLASVMYRSLRSARAGTEHRKIWQDA